MDKLIYFLLLLVQVNSKEDKHDKSSPCTDQNHIFLTPGVLFAGGTSRACVSRFHHEGGARMVLSLRIDNQLVSHSLRELPPGDGGCLDIPVPQIPNSQGDLTISIRYPDAQCIWERTATLRMCGSRIVSVVTERARYRPGDTLRIRAIVLRPDLTPVAVTISEIWLEDPHGGQVFHQLDVKSRLGVAQTQFVLDSVASPGKWRVRAKLADGSQGSAAFWVGNYEIPPFQLSVKHQPKVLSTSDKLVWVVCVRYPWTEAVEGMLVIRIRGVGAPIYNDTKGIRTAVRLKTPRACHRHSADASRIGLDSDNPPDVVVADFAFQEEGTRIWQNTTVVSKVVDKPVTLEFLTKSSASVSTGLPNKLKVKATRWDDKPAPNERIQLCWIRSEAPSLGSVCEDAITDVAGVARIIFSTEYSGSLFYKFQAFLKNDTSIKTEPLILPVQKQGSVQVTLGTLKVDQTSGKTYVPLYLNQWNFTRALTVHFVVITRGGIINRWGATTQCPISSKTKLIRTVPKNSVCIEITDQTPFRRNVSNANKFFKYVVKMDDTDKPLETNAADAILESQLARIILPIKFSQQMCPESHLVAYFYHNGEFISTSKQFEMEECFVNKVELSWVTNQISPGSSATLQINTPGPALCAVTAVDSAAKWNQPSPSIKDYIMKGLKRLMAEHSNFTEYDASRECFLTADTPYIPITNAERAAAWLAGAGVRVLGGEFNTTRYCANKPSALLSEDIVTRNDFSEAWLWLLQIIGPNGTSYVSALAPDSITTYEASAFCVARNGVGVSNTATLQVFREFFIHADGPKRLRVGDSSIINYRVFNYLYEPLSVEFNLLTGPHLEGPANLDTACLGARASLAGRIAVRARSVGSASFSIRVVTREQDGRCGNITAGNSKAGIRDEVVIQIAVDPEGVRIQEHKSILLCGKDTQAPGARNLPDFEVTWTWPKVQAVPGTEHLMVWTTADLKGPLLADADDLIMLPRGCGEQNMARLAYNLLALSLLDPHTPAALNAREHVARGYTRQLQYAHPTGGFSAFGVADGTPSTWLTAFVVKYLWKAHRVLTPEYQPPPALELAEQWLLAQQMENGCFRNEGQVFHRELRENQVEDAEAASVALTAYVIISLLDSSPLSVRVFDNAVTCLRAFPTGKKTPSSIYAQSLLTYTFMRLRNYEDNLKGINEVTLQMPNKYERLEKDEELQSLVELMETAKRNGNYIWWETGTLSTSIEATSYALLALSFCPKPMMHSHCAPEARGIMRWLSQHRSAFGGFVSTQDTLVALEALIAWQGIEPSGPANLNVTIKEGLFKKTFEVKTGTKVPEVVKINAREIHVGVEGTGCALVQATRFYNTLSPEVQDNRTLSVRVSVGTDGPFNCDNQEKNCYCAAVIQACVLWTGYFPEMALLEMTLPGGYRADPSLLFSQLHQPDGLIRRIEMAPYGGKANLYLASKDGLTNQAGHSCFTVNAVGPQAKTKPAHAKVYDYYNPMVVDTQMYTIPADCPPRLGQIKDNYIASENLFISAKSPDGGLKISDDNIEDTPEPENSILGEVVLENKEGQENNKLDKDKTEPLVVNKKIQASRVIEASKSTTNDAAEVPTVKTDDSLIKTSETHPVLTGRNSPKIYDKISKFDEELENHDKLISNLNLKHNKLISNFNDETDYDANIESKRNNLQAVSLSDEHFEGYASKTFPRNINKNFTPKNIKFQLSNDSINENITKHENTNDSEKEFSEEDLKTTNSQTRGNLREDHPEKQNTSTLELRNENITEKLSPETIDIDAIMRHNLSHSAYIPKLQLREDIDSITENLTFLLNEMINDNVNATKKNFDKNFNETHTEIRDETFNENHFRKQDNKKTQPRNENCTEKVEQDQEAIESDVKIRLNISNTCNISNNTDHSTFNETDRSNKIINKAENVEGNEKNVHNPNLSDFHVIDSPTDLDVPDGVEGPIPSIVLPPEGSDMFAVYKRKLPFENPNMTVMPKPTFLHDVRHSKMPYRTGQTAKLARGSGTHNSGWSNFTPWSRDSYYSQIQQNKSLYIPIPIYDDY